MKKLATIWFSLIVALGYSQCNQYFIYESFSTALPTQQGTWINTSVLYGTTSSTARTGANYLTFNALNDAIRLPQSPNPGVLTFYYRRSSTSTGTPKFSVETSPNGTTWTERLAVTTFSTTYALASVDIGALGLTNVHIRIIDKRASGTAERYIDDLGLTSTTTSSNTLIPFLSSCSSTLNSSFTYSICDDTGPQGTALGGYTNNVSRTVTFTPSDNTKKLNLSFSQLDLETTYDYLYVYDGPNTSSPLLATLNGTTLPSDIIATNSSGQLTLRWTTDVSNVGAWGGFLAAITSTTPLPVELIYFEGTKYPTFNSLKWATASEHNSSHFDLERSTDGIEWKVVRTKTAAGNSTEEITYSYLDAINQFTIHYYRLVQYDIDGKFKIYGPIAIDNSNGFKRVVKCVNLLGQEIGPEYKGIVFEIYEDGSSKKTIR